MLVEYIFISCDIVAHSAEPSLELQLEHVRDINAIVAAFLTEYGQLGAVWASGGDGGHTAIPQRPDSIQPALEVLLALRRWSIRKGVRLRVCASVGNADEIEGADGRKQLVGPGINVAGRMLPYGASDRVVVTQRFQTLVLAAGHAGINFHEAVRVAPRNAPAMDVALLSVANEFRSTWHEPESSDRALLRKALADENALEVIYRARRLLELSSLNAEADGALRVLGDMTIRGKRNFLHKLIQDEHVGPELVRLGNVIERRAGEIVCSHGDNGTSMFLILKGCIQVFFPQDSEQPSAPGRTHSIVMHPGELGGELAFALRRNRTATLQCLEDTALLGFTYEELLQSFASAPERGGLVKEALDREIRAKILENFCNTAPFFQPVRAAASSAVREAPWKVLVRYSSVDTVALTRSQLTIPADDNASDGLVFLVSGTIRVEGDKNTITGLGYPLVHAHLPPNVTSQPLRLTLTDDCQFLRIQRDALMQLGIEAFDAAVDQALSSPISAPARRYVR